MAKKNNEKKPLIVTKRKMDNSVEVQLTKSPSKTLFGKIVAWAICILTLCVPLAGLIYLFVMAAK